MPLIYAAPLQRIPPFNPLVHNLPTVHFMDPRQMLLTCSNIYMYSPPHLHVQSPASTCTAPCIYMYSPPPPPPPPASTCTAPCVYMYSSPASTCTAPPPSTCTAPPSTCTAPRIYMYSPPHPKKKICKEADMPIQAVVIK